MEPKKGFDGFDPAEHEEEARSRWGDTDAYREAARRTKEYTSEDWARIKTEDRVLMEKLAESLRRGAKPDDDAVLELAERHRLHIDRWYYPCSHAMHAGLAEMYVSDERFTAAIDVYQEGLAAFLAEAIRANATRR